MTTVTPRNLLDEFALHVISVAADRPTPGTDPAAVTDLLAVRAGAGVPDRLQSAMLRGQILSIQHPKLEGIEFDVKGFRARFLSSHLEDIDLQFVATNYVGDWWQLWNNYVSLQIRHSTRSGPRADDNVDTSVIYRGIVKSVEPGAIERGQTTPTSITLMMMLDYWKQPATTGADVLINLAQEIITIKGVNQLQAVHENLGYATRAVTPAI